MNMSKIRGILLLFPDNVTISFYNESGIICPIGKQNTIRTGSYPQIHHNTSLLTPNGWINCTKFVDANGKIYDDWIPAIRLE
ncbi:MAG: hypothetical protein J7I99_05215 [Methanophagales archaeon]|nr:hypothetical protein [Methanophagales archaeon]